MNRRHAGEPPPSGYSVRQAMPDDTGAIAELLSASAEAAGMQSLVTPAELQIEWDRSHRWAVIGPDTRAVGHAALSGRNAEGCVHPNHRGQGIGAYLVRLLEHWYQGSLRSSGSPHGTLRHWVLGDDRPAHRILTDAGYAP